jgi:hypothetical protein
MTGTGSHILSRVSESDLFIAAVRPRHSRVRHAEARSRQMATGR